MTSPLFAPISFRDLTLANRIMVSPMCQYSAVDGSATDWHLIHLGHLALGGAGLLFVEATAVEAIGRITPGCLGLYSDANERALRGVVEAIRRHSPVKLGIQLAHAGRKASSEVPWRGGQLIAPERGGWRPVAPSAVPQLAQEAPPEALDRAGMERIRNAFVASARRALHLGFDAIELHSAHGYLLHEFLSPISNRREDGYGGPAANRMRFPLECFEAVRAAWPSEKPLGVRVSATDWVEGGWDLDQSIELCRRLAAAGVDLIDCSSGGSAPDAVIPFGPGYQVRFAEAIRREARVPTAAVGLITSAAQAESILATGQADAVCLARELLRDPYWPLRAARELGVHVPWPVQYERARPS